VTSPAMTMPRVVVSCVWYNIVGEQRISVRVKGPEQAWTG
jgi:hypothetical protein